MSRRRPTTPEDLTEFGELLEPTEALAPILARPVRDALMAWLEEIWAGKDLEAVGLSPRTRAIFDGQPGSGKTTLAHHLCGRLGLRMLAVRSESIIDCWVGSSARNAGRLFDLIAGQESDQDQIVLFFDEFESIAGARKRDHGGGDDERNRAVDVLLQRIERHQGFIIAATNHAEMIDPAIWRRFDLQITLALPGQEEREHILARYLHPYGLPRRQRVLLAEAFATASPALIRRWCEDLKRSLVLGPRLGWDMGRAAVADRLVATIAPHPDCGKPRLWSRGSRDAAIVAMSWPLPLAADLPVDESPAPIEGDKIVKLGRRR